jgi:hypothetical protein
MNETREKGPTKPQRELLERLARCIQFGIRRERLCVPDKRLMTRLVRLGWAQRVGVAYFITTTGMVARGIKALRAAAGEGDGKNHD